MHKTNFNFSFNLRRFHKLRKQKELNNKLESIKLLYVSLLSSSYQIQTPSNIPAILACTIDSYCCLLFTAPRGMSSGDESDPVEEKVIHAQFFCYTLINFIIIF